MFVITDKGGVKIAALFQEDSEYAKSQVIAAVLAGMNVVHERGGAEVLAQSRRTENATPKPQLAWKRKPLATKAPADEVHVKTGDTVYLNWPEMNNAARLDFNTKRMSRGVVKDFRRGQGVARTVGVCFDDDPELTWLRPSELAFSLQVED